MIQDWYYIRIKRKTSLFALAIVNLYKHLFTFSLGASIVARPATHHSHSSGQFENPERQITKDPT